MSGFEKPRCLGLWYVENGALSPTILAVPSEFADLLSVDDWTVLLTSPVSKPSFLACSTFHRDDLGSESSIFGPRVNVFVVMESALSCGNGVDGLVTCRPPKHLCGDCTSCGCVAHGLVCGGTLVVRRAVATLGDDLSPLGPLGLLRGRCWVRTFKDMERCWRRGFCLGCFILLRPMMSRGGGFAFAEGVVGRLRVE